MWNTNNFQDHGRSIIDIVNLMNGLNLEASPKNVDSFALHRLIIMVTDKMIHVSYCNNDHIEMQVCKCAIKLGGLWGGTVLSSG